jgi:hypothetical protein
VGIPVRLADIPGALLTGIQKANALINVLGFELMLDSKISLKML